MLNVIVYQFTKMLNYGLKRKDNIMIKDIKFGFSKSPLSDISLDIYLKLG